jgi:hypothetical protein
MEAHPTHEHADLAPDVAVTCAVRTFSDYKNLDYRQCLVKAAATV